MRIILMRHGKPDLAESKPLASHEFHQWINAYNHAPLCEQSTPNAEAQRIASECALTVCSHLRRSQESARRLGLSVAHSGEIFREMEMPHGKLLLPKFSPAFWAILFRCLWFMGYTRNSESFSSARNRAVIAAQQLQELARQHQSVIFVGHGLFNRYVAKELRRNGWSGLRNPSPRYWEYGVYQLKQEKKHDGLL